MNFNPTEIGVILHPFVRVKDGHGKSLCGRLLRRIYTTPWRLKVWVRGFLVEYNDTNFNNVFLFFLSKTNNNNNNFDLVLPSWSYFYRLFNPYCRFSANILFLRRSIFACSSGVRGGGGSSCVRGGGELTLLPSSSLLVSGGALSSSSLSVSGGQVSSWKKEIDFSKYISDVDEWYRSVWQFRLRNSKTCFPFLLLCQCLFFVHIFAVIFFWFVLVNLRGCLVIGCAKWAGWLAGVQTA